MATKALAARTREELVAALDGSADAILGAASPAEAKKLGRLVRGFDQARWNAERFGIVVEGSVHKFGQDPALRDFLLGTANRVLVEASPRDLIWGIGLGAANEAAGDPRRWRGRNLLGFALMEARERLAADAAAATASTASGTAQDSGS